jgi:tetratricopeptide (TPR) repeat protein
VDLDKAVTALRRAAVLAPEHQEVKVQQAVLQMQTCPLDATAKCRPQWQAAAKTLRQVLRAAPDNFDAAYRLGVTELYSGRADKALGYLRLAHQLAPWAPRINLHLGDCLRMLGAPSARDYLTNARAWAQDEATYYLADAALELIDISAAPNP